MTTTAQATEFSPATLAAAAFALRDLTKNYNRHIAWQTAALAYSKAKQADLNPDELKLSAMPSKAAKHRMYGEAHRLISILSLDVGHPSTLADIALVIHAAYAVISA